MIASGLPVVGCAEANWTRGAALSADPGDPAVFRDPRQGRLAGRRRGLCRAAGRAGPASGARSAEAPSSARRRRGFCGCRPTASTRCVRCREMGMDSLMAVELRLALESRLRRRSAADVVGRGNERQLDRRAARRRARRQGKERRNRRTGRRATRAADEGGEADGRSCRGRHAAAETGCGGIARWPPGATFSDCRRRPRRACWKRSRRRRCGWRGVPAAALHRQSPSAASRLDVAELEGYREIRMIREAAAFLGIADPFFRVHQGIAGGRNGDRRRTYINFASYNYIGLNGHPRIAAAAKAAIDRYGTSVSASRPVSGERPVHRELEQALARIHGAEDSIVFVGGHSTNVTVIGHLLGPQRRHRPRCADPQQHRPGGDAVRGAAGAVSPISITEAADRLLGEARSRNGHALLVVEGHYSMDGDVPDLPAFIAVARRHRAWLMVDEAHALGVLGPRGFGIGRPFRHRSGRGRHLDGDAEQEPGFVRRLHRRAGRSDRLSEAGGAGLCVLGRDGAGGGGGGARGTRNPGARAGAGAPAQRARRRCFCGSRARAGSMSAARSARPSCRSSPAARSAPRGWRRRCSGAASTSSRSSIRRCRSGPRGCGSS